MKGQAANWFVVLLFGLFFLIGFGATAPVYQNFIDMAAPSLSVNAQALAGLIPLVILLSGLFAIWLYMTGR